MSAAKTPGQVAQDARCNDAMTTEGHWEAIAAAVIAHHEATRPAWPPTRPMSEAGERKTLIVLLLRDQEARVVKRKSTMDGEPRWEDVETGEWYTPDELGGWWPLPAGV